MALISTHYTYDFVTSNLPPGAGRVFEIGCGDGALAALVQADGLEVTAIDSDPDAVEAAKSAGVDARLIAWPASIGGTFDAVLFTRSLHHIHPLGEAVAEAIRALRPNGRIIVEDFRAEGGSEVSATWFADLALELWADGDLRPDTSVDELLQKLAPDDHELHSSFRIAEALSAFGTVQVADAAYYFRYLEPHLREPGKARGLLDLELSLVESRTIDALGKRFVVTAR